MSRLNRLIYYFPVQNAKIRLNVATHRIIPVLKVRRWLSWLELVTFFLLVIPTVFWSEPTIKLGVKRVHERSVPYLLDSIVVIVVVFDFTCLVIMTVFHMY